MRDPFEMDAAREDQLVLVDALDRELGTASKERAHREGLLHRAFSVVLTRGGDEGPELLLARRAPGKYHSAGLWANSCCSHPRAGEELSDAVPRRLQEELGCGARGLHEIGSFVYRTDFGGLYEFEYDHVYLGEIEGEPAIDPAEVDALRWVSAAELVTEIAGQPQLFASWALTVLPMALANLCQSA